LPNTLVELAAELFPFLFVRNASDSRNLRGPDQSQLARRRRRFAAIDEAKSAVGARRLAGQALEFEAIVVPQFAPLYFPSSSFPPTGYWSKGIIGLSSSRLPKPA